MKIDKNTTVDIDIEGFCTLTAAEAWPDGPPDEITAAQFADEIVVQSTSLASFLRDWNLLDGVEVTLIIRNGKDTDSATLYE